MTHLTCFYRLWHNGCAVGCGVLMWRWGLGAAESVRHPFQSLAETNSAEK